MALIFNGAASSGGHSGLQRCVWRETELVRRALKEEQPRTNEAIRALNSEETSYPISERRCM